MELEHLKPFLEEIVKIQKVEGTPEPTSSYMGGHPFVPSNNEIWKWPKDPSGDPMIFVIQINFKDVPVGFGYPEDGLIQIFIDVSAYEYDYDGGLKILYYNEDELRLESKFSISDLVESPDDEKCKNIYFDKTAKKIELNVGFQIPFELYRQAALFEDSDGTNEGAKRLHEILSENKKEIDNDFTWYSHQLGGTPYWIQYPAFGNDGDPIPTFVLQIDSDDDIMFGDAGNMQVFGSLEKLHEGDFSGFKWDWACS